MHSSWRWCVASRALDQGCGLLLTPRQREAQHARVEGDVRLERPHGRGLPAHRAVDPRDALEDDGARHHLLLPRVAGRHSRHAASCSTARSSPLRPATPASTPTGLSWNKTAKNTHPARYDPANVGWLWSLSCRTGRSCRRRKSCQARPTGTTVTPSSRPTPVYASVMACCDSGAFSRAQVM